MIEETFKGITEPFTAMIEGWKEGREEARRERQARHLDYQCKLVERFNYSPREFYVLLAKALEERRVPGLEAGVVKLFESVYGSSKRLYMTVARERFVYYVCAAPYGTGFFFSWRLVDERRPAKWFVAAFILLNIVTGILSSALMSPTIRLLTALNFDAQSLSQIALWLPSLLFLFLFAAIWSLMRCAALPGYERLSIFIEKVPFFGRVFERLFRPDTYYRQDSQKMYQKVFDLAITETIAAVTTPQGLRNAGVDGSPVVADLHWK